MAITQQLSFVDQLSQYKAVIDVAVGEHARTLIEGNASMDNLKEVLDVLGTKVLLKTESQTPSI